MKFNHIKAHIAAFLAILMVSYFASMIICLHTHEVNGVVVMHSHPYQSASHSHTNAQITLFSQLNNFESFLSVDELIKSPILNQIGESHSSLFFSILSISVEYSSLRAPPVC